VFRWLNNTAYLGNNYLGKIVGTHFACVRDSKKHYFRIFQGWGFNKQLIESLIKKDIMEIRVIVDDGRRLLITTPQDVSMMGKNYQAQGYEPQFVLPEANFDKKFEMEV